MTVDAQTLEPRRRLPHAAAAQGVLFATLERLRHGALELRLPDGARRQFGDGNGEPVVLEVLDERLFRRLALRGRLGPGEGYTAGEWRASDLVGLFELFARNADGVFEGGPLARLARAAGRLPRLPRLSTLGRAERDIHRHYDLGNDFFALWLDPSLTYSCGLFESEQQSLADAQQAKYRRLCEHLRLGPDDHLLEIGSGWGGMAIHAARERGARVTTVTISREQHELARRRVAEAGLAERVEVLYRDYRQVEGRYDKIVSIEMIEAIGHAQYPTYFAALERLLAPGGIVALQAILIPDERYERYRRQRDWVRTYIFPGGLLPSLTALQSAMTRASRLMVHSVEEIGPHYARTLREWRERFLATREEARRLGYDEPFLRTWEYYLAFCEAGFRTRALRDVQIVLTRPLNTNL